MRFNLIILLATTLVSFVKGQTESFVPTKNSTITLFSEPLSHTFSSRLHKDLFIPLNPQHSDVGYLVLGNTTNLRVGQFRFGITSLHSGNILPQAFPYNFKGENDKFVFDSPATFLSRRFSSAFDDGVNSHLILWKGKFHHKNFTYQSKLFNASVHFAEVQPSFQLATSDFAQRVEKEIASPLPLNATGVKAKGVDLAWKPSGQVNLQAFSNTVKAQNGTKMETHMLRFGSAHIGLRWDKLLAEDMNQMSSAVINTQQPILRQVLGNDVTLPINGVQVWQDFQKEGSQISYENKGVMMNLQKLKLEGTAGEVLQSNTKVALGEDQLLWLVQKSNVTKVSRPDALKAVGLADLATLVGWQKERQQLSVKFDKHNLFRNESLKMNSENSKIDDQRLTLSVADGKFRWERTQKEVSPDITPEQLKTLNLTEMANFLGQKVNVDRWVWQLSPNLSITYTKDDVRALPSSSLQFQQNQSHETVLSIQPDSQTKTTIAFGGWTMKLYGETNQPISSRHLLWTSERKLPIFGGLQLTMERKITEIQQNGKEQDNRYARIVLQTAEKAPVQIFLERKTYNEAEKMNQETVNARLSFRLSRDLQLVTQLSKNPQNGLSVENRQHSLTYQPRPDLQLTAQWTKFEQGNSHHQQAQVDMTFGNLEKGSTQQWKWYRFKTNTPATNDSNGWRIGWNLTTKDQIKWTIRWGQGQREDGRKGHDRKLTFESTDAQGKCLTWRLGYWQFNLIDAVEPNYQQFLSTVQSASQPVPQIGTPSPNLLPPQVESCQTIWMTTGKSDWHLATQISRSTNNGQDASERRIYLEIPPKKSRTWAIRFGFWKLKPFSGDEQEVPTWRIVLPLGKGELAFGSATYTDQNGKLPMREFMFIFPMDKRGSQLMISNLTNMPPDWGQKWQQQDWMRLPNELALAPQILFTRTKLTSFKQNQAILTWQINSKTKLISQWTEQISNPNHPKIHDRNFGLEWAPRPSTQWRLGICSAEK